MKNTVIERIIEFCNLNEYSINKLSQLMEMQQVTVNNYINGNRKVSYEFIESFVRTFGINANWLLTGEGDMLGVGSAPLNSSEDINKDISLPIETKPRIPYSAAAGGLTHALDGGFLHQCEQIPVIAAFPKYDFTIQVKGESMQPAYFAGDEIACLKIEECQFIQWGRVYVLDTAQGIVLKRVYDNGDSIRCVSYNKDYPDFNISKSEIYGMGLVVGMIRV